MEEQLSPEQQELIDAVDGFAAKMKERLIQKAGQGYSGWNNQYDLSTVFDAIHDRKHRILDPNNDGEIGIANWCLIAHLIKNK